MDPLMLALVIGICVVLLVYLILVLTSTPSMFLGAHGLSESDKLELYIYAGCGHFDITRIEYNQLPRAERIKVINMGKRVTK
jgi:hypothetical protein